MADWPLFGRAESLYGDLEYRQIGGLERPLPDLPPGTVRLEAEPRVDYGDLALQAAQAGVLGGTVGAGAGAIRGLDLESPSRELVFRGLGPRPGGGRYDPLGGARSWHDAAYGSPNPSVAASYAGPGPMERVRMAERLVAEAGGRLPVDPGSQAQRAARGVARDAATRRAGLMPRQAGQVAPLWVPTSSTVEFPWREAGMTPEGAMYSPEWNEAALAGDPGVVTTARGVVDPSDDLFESGAAAGMEHAPSRQFSWGKDVPVELAGESFSVEEAGQLVRDSARRLGLDPDIPVPGHLQDAVIGEVANDPRFKPSAGARAGQLIKRGLKSAFSAKNILAGALQGGAVGAGSAVAGYASGAPESAGGLFTAPGPGYEEMVRPADIERITGLKQQRKEALRQQYIDEINERYGRDTVGPSAQINEISEYLGPVYWPTGGWGQ